MKLGPEESAAQLVREHVIRQPDPPRESSWAQISWVFYRARGDRLMVFFGLALAAFVAFALLSAESPSGLYVVVGVVAFLFAVACVAAPAALAYRVSRAVRDGVLESATALEVASEGGRLAGRLSIPHAKGSFTFDFSEEMWVVDGVEPGSVVEVLVDPRRQRVLFVVGTTRATA